MPGVLSPGLSSLLPLFSRLPSPPSFQKFLGERKTVWENHGLPKEPWCRNLPTQPSLSSRKRTHGRREKSGRRLERPGLRTPGIYMGKEINSLSSLCWQDKLGHVAPKKGLRSHLCSSQPSQHASQYVNVWPAQTQKPPPEILVGFLRMPRRQ